MGKKIKVIIKEPGGRPRSVHISDSLANLQKTVGGHIETVTLASDTVVVCDEEGRIKSKPFCCEICGVDFVGTVIIAGIAGEDFADIPMDFKTAKRLFPKLFENGA